jgi:hypothetical protein
MKKLLLCMFIVSNFFFINAVMAGSDYASECNQACQSYARGCNGNFTADFDSPWCYCKCNGQTVISIKENQLPDP